MKFFYRKHGCLTKHIQAWKIYDVMPNTMPEVFRNSKLVCYDSVDIECFMSGVAKVETHEHSMTDAETIKKRLTECVEISEEKFNSIYNRCENLKNEIKQVIEDEDIM